jgi:hypothetical protein
MALGFVLVGLMPLGANPIDGDRLRSPERALPVL